MSSSNYEHDSSQTNHVYEHAQGSSPVPFFVMTIGIVSQHETRVE